MKFYISRKEAKFLVILSDFSFLSAFFAADQEIRQRIKIFCDLRVLCDEKLHCRIVGHV